ncbi:AAA family ATPase [Ferroplasma sp.]|uniref:AAA family ATPase n=1 Tax=Ferroplasma sp. TaxID=2591003 RepID=UPI00261A7E48|nr:AAA family ATPase [Ferroplasma sp.]
MENDEIEFEIKNIGPIKKSIIRTKNITTILGLPNSGKSYALRSIYWFLQLLDEYRFKEFNRLVNHVKSDEILENKIMNDMNKEIEKELNGIVDDFISNKQNIPHEVYKNNIKINYKINLEKLKLLIKGVFKDTLKQYTGSSNIKNIKVNGKSIDTIIDDSISEIPIFGSEYSKDDNGLHFMYSIPRNSNFTPEQYYEIMKKLRRHPLTVTINPMNISKAGTSINVDVTFSISRATDQYLQERLDFYGLNFASTNISIENFPYMGIIISNISENIWTSIINFSLKNIKSAISDISGINSIKFIPYGRNIIVQLYNNSLKKSLYYPGEILEDLSVLKSAPFSSYFKWLDAGREKLNNNQNELINLFNFIINGEIKSDSNTNALKYFFGDNKSVDIVLSSAMVEEITGLMLPIISSNDKDLIIIEEPEAQLHISTQIIMGILLVALVKKKDIKIIFSTHSDTLVIVMNYLLTQHVEKNDVQNLVKAIYNNQFSQDNLNDLINVFDDKKKIDIKFYSNKDDKFMLIDNKDILKEIPGITDFIDRLFNWSIGVISKTQKDQNGENKND